MAEQKRRRGKWARAEHFTKAANGEYVYTGKHFHFTDEKWSYRGTMAVRWILAAVVLAVAVAGGCIPAPGMGGCFYVILPYVGTLLGAVSLMWAVCRMTYWGNPLREYVHQATVRQIPLRGLITGILALCTLVGEIVFLLLEGRGEAGVFCTFLLISFQILIILCILLWRFLEKGWSWTVSP